MRDRDDGPALFFDAPSFLCLYPNEPLGSPLWANKVFEGG